MIKAVLFDAGGVLHYSHTTVEQEMRDEFDLSDKQVHELFTHYEPLIGTGKMTEYELWKELHKKWGIRKVTKDEKIFTKHFEKKLKKIPGMYDLVDELKSKDIIVGLLTNVSPEYATVLKAHGHYEPFDVAVLSYEVGSWKPDPAIYFHALEKIGSKPEETIFIDDRINNVLIAEAIGIHGIEFRNVQQVKNELTDILKALNPA